MLGDLVAVGRNRLSGGRGPRESAYADLQVRPMGEAVTRYYIGLDVADRAGVLASVAQTFAAHDVSIETLRQDRRGDEAALVVVTHKATDAALSGVVGDLRDAGRRPRGRSRSCGWRASERDAAVAAPGRTSGAE